MAKPAARVSDTDACPLPGHGPNPVTAGSPNVLINNLPCARVGDPTACGDAIAVGIPIILVNGKPIAHLGSSTAHGGVIISGSGDVLLGSVGGGAPMSPVGALQILGAHTQQAAATLSTAKATPAPAYDEQLQFQNAQGQPYSMLPYTLTLADGSQASGTTDAQGRTERIQTATPTAITSATLSPPVGAKPCCGKASGGTSSSVKTITLPTIRTNANQLGNSVQSVTVEGDHRPLSAGEIDMAKTLFRDAIDYTRVKVHREEYLPLGLQPNDTAMTPNGDLYFNPARFKEDFSQEADYLKHWFMHEMVHVWQYQLGYSVRLKGLLIHPGSLWGLLGDPYAYKLEATKTLSDYNMEQQGDILADYHALKHGLRATSASGSKVSAPALFDSVLADFLKDPGDANNLP